MGLAGLTRYSGGGDNMAPILITVGTPCPHAMAKNATADGERTETERFSKSVSASELIEGDRIDKMLVARTPGQYGERIDPHTDSPQTQLVAVTQMNRYDDVHSALLLDPESDLFVRASRHESSQAWTQAEEDWKVREIGSEVVVEEVHELERPDEEQDEDAHEYVQVWVEILFDSIRISGGDSDLRDERELDGTTLKLNDYDGRKATATISLSDD